MAYTEFYMQSTGSDLNAGSTNADAAANSYTGLDWNGSTTITRASGSFVTDGVTAGMWASIYADGASAWVYTAQITTVAALTLTISTTRKAGTAPGSGTANRSVKVGGAWATRAVFDAMGTAVDLRDTTSGLTPCINVKGTLADVTTDATVFGCGSAPAALVVYGYTTTVRDGGYATIQQTSGTAIVAYRTANYVTTRNFIFDGGSPTVSSGGSVFIACQDYSPYINCRFRNYQGQVRPSTTLEAPFILCQFYKGNQMNTSATGGLYCNSAEVFVYGCTFYECKQAGLYTNEKLRVLFCAFVNNKATTGDGITLGGANKTAIISNSTFANNAGNAIRFASDLRMAIIDSCLFRSNTGTDIAMGSQSRLNTLIFKNAYYRTSGSFLSTSVSGEENTTALGSDPFTGDPTLGDLSVNSQVAGLGMLTGYTPDLATTSTAGNLDVGMIQVVAAGAPPVGNGFNPGFN